MKIKVIYIICFAILNGLFAVSGCINKEVDDTRAPINHMDKEPVTFHHYFTDSLSGGIEALVSEYNNQQALYEAKVVPIDHEAYKISILESFKRGVPSDLNSYWAGARTADVVNYLEPLDDLFVEDNLKALFSQEVLESASLYDGQYYLLPITQHYINFYYNLEVFESLGLKEPKNWEEFISVCETLKNSGITPIGLGAKDKWPAQFWFDYLLLRTAGNDYRNGLLSGSNHYTDEEVVNTIKIWKYLIDEDYFNENAIDIGWDFPIVEPLMEGQYGMTLNGTWMLSILNESGYEGQYGVFSFPVMDESMEIVALGPIDGIIIGKDAINIEGAKDAILHFSTIENQTKMAKGSGSFIPNIQAGEAYYDELQLKLLEDIRRSDAWAMNYDLATEPNNAKHGLDFFVEFLAYPEAFLYLLEELERSVE